METSEIYTMFAKWGHCPDCGHCSCGKCCHNGPCMCKTSAEIPEATKRKRARDRKLYDLKKQREDLKKQCSDLDREISKLSKQVERHNG